MEYETDTNTVRAVFQQSSDNQLDSNNNSRELTYFNQAAAEAPSTSTSLKKKKITDFFQVTRSWLPQKQQKLEKEFLYIPAENITTEDVIRNGGRTTLKLNDQEVALVTHRDKIYAIEPKCPHIGGPIHLGDIEDVPGCGPCIKCPWHSWTFSLTTGRCIFPQNRDAGVNLATFPVKVDSFTKNTIKIGFTEISAKSFSLPPE